MQCNAEVSETQHTRGELQLITLKGIIYNEQFYDCKHCSVNCVGFQWSSAQRPRFFRSTKEIGAIYFFELHFCKSKFER